MGFTGSDITDFFGRDFRIAFICVHICVLDVLEKSC